MSSQPAHYRTRPREGLTPRQREVIGLIARGYTNAQIAESLGISLDGAKFHVSEIIARLGVESREQAAEVWREQQRPAARLRALFAIPFGAKMLGAGIAGVLATLVIGVAIALALNGGGESPASPPGGEATTSGGVPWTLVPVTLTPAPSPAADPLATPRAIDPATVDRPVRVVNVDAGEERTLPVSWAAISWSPDGSHMIVAGDVGTEVVERTSNLVLRLSDRPSFAVAWSPDGKKLAVSEHAQAGIPGRTAIYDPVGKLLAELPEGGATLAWSLDSKMLASARKGAESWVWSGGSDVTFLGPDILRFRWLRDGRLVATEAPAVRSPISAVLIDPAADFARIEELSVPHTGPEPAASWNLVFISGEGDVVVGGETEVTWLPFASDRESAAWINTSLGYIADATSWPSPVGSRTLAVRDLCTPDEALMVLGPDEKGHEVAGGGVSTAAWSPDASRIDYTNGFEPRVVNADGSGTRVVADQVMATMEPVWSPDGKWLAFVGFFGGWGRCD